MANYNQVNPSEHCIRKNRLSSLTQHAEPVVHGHHNHVAIGGQDAGIEHVPRPFHVRASVDEEHHWLLPAVADICKNPGGRI